MVREGREEVERLLVEVGLVRVVVFEVEEERVVELLDNVDRVELDRLVDEGLAELLDLLGEDEDLEVEEGLLTDDLEDVDLGGLGFGGAGLGVAVGFDGGGLGAADDFDGDGLAEGKVTTSVTTTTSITVAGPSSATGAGGISLRIGRPRGGVFAGGIFAGGASATFAFSAGAAHSIPRPTSRTMRRTNRRAISTVRISVVC